jgi:hypothetical protein
MLANWGYASYLDLDPGLVEDGYQVLGFAGSAAAVWFDVGATGPKW